MGADDTNFIAQVHETIQSIEYRPCSSMKVMCLGTESFVWQVKWLYTIVSGIIHLVHRLEPLDESEGQTRVYTKLRGGLG